jgi:hypothetical protein
MTLNTTNGAIAPITNANGTDAGVALAEHAEEIRTLGRRACADIIEIGRRLTECKALVGHGRWRTWLECEFGWSDDTAANYIRAYKLTQEEEFKYRNFRNLNIGVSALYLIAQQSTPSEARTEIIERAEAGEALPIAKVKRVIKARKKPKPAKKPEAKHGPVTDNAADAETSAERRKQEAADAEVAEDAAAAKAQTSELAIEQEIELLREFAEFVINRTKVTTDPKDHAEFKALLDRTKQVLGGGQ